MGSQQPDIAFRYIELFLNNFSLWPLIAAAALIWLLRQPNLLGRITKFSFGGFAIELEKLREELEENREQIISLESEIERNRRAFSDILEGFDPNAPLEKVVHTRNLLTANARALKDLSAVREMLSASASAEQIYAAAVTLRERRATEFYPDVVLCLDRLADQPNLGGIRLNTIWTLVSALHRMLIASIRDGIKPSLSNEQLKRSKAVLKKLAVNPRVLLDRPDAPEKGVLGPLKLALRWIDQADANQKMSAR